MVTQRACPPVLDVQVCYIHRIWLDCLCRGDGDEVFSQCSPVTPSCCRRLPCQASVVPGVNHDYLLHGAPTLPPAAPEDSSSKCQTKAVSLRQLLTLPPGLRLPKIRSIMSDEILLNRSLNNRKIKPSSWRTFRELTESFQEVASRYILIQASNSPSIQTQEEP